ncbi:Spore maturation protein A [uncultured Roseburia sp.]|uniref:Nucleoside recognition protein n=1 Tax=Brotonthovivens ammoniilytica TaxID=2981725 RepID=A0ABT2TJB9_9FIRM|nr:nucleoside recognition domain-containing protein [Brotonthovivens ammoniilytica]MCU6761732.1 nucleoside recognition protein [Brotonthovivens ammoniilytica]SCI44899.1 Spore maturation protein A [uncultured Roseburia sp.]
MLNFLWAFMILIGIIYAALQGNLAAVTDAALESAGEAVTLCITMAGVMAFWVGMMRIAENGGLLRAAAKRLRPFLRFLFPDIPKDHPANQAIAVNCIANIFGLGWAATPAGLDAMKKMQQLNTQNPQRASNSMCTFLVLNISSLQLIPVNIIAYRSQYGSVNPTSIVGMAIVATMVSTAAGIVFAKIMCLTERKRHV